MSYNDDYNQRGGDYQQPSERSEYGGGGRGSDNYYAQSDSYGGNDGDNRGERRYQGGGGDHNQSSGGYGGQGQGQGGYGGQEGYGGQGGGGYGGGSNDQYSGAVHHATQHGSSEDQSLFSQATSFLGQHHSRLQNEDIDEGQAVNAHKVMYGDGSGGGQQQQHSSQTVGAGAAMQALKMFTGQGGGQGQGGGLGGGAGGGQNQFIGMAMAQASKLFDRQAGQGNVVSSTLCCPNGKLTAFLHRTLQRASSPPLILRQRWRQRCTSRVRWVGADLDSWD